MAQETITYSDLVNRYGKHMAFDLLLTIEKLAKIKDDLIHLNEETRLLKALKELDKMNCAESYS